MVEHYKDVFKNSRIFILTCYISKVRCFANQLILCYCFCKKGRIYIHIYVNLWKDMHEANESLHI